MQVQFHGAAGMVTGSMHLVEAGGHRVLLDCGMIQGNREADALNLAPFPFDIGSIDALVVSHAHIDHIGRIPLLVKRGYRGPIFAQDATADLIPIMLLDSAHIAESDARRDNEHRRDGEPESVPLYTPEDVEATLKLLRPQAYGKRFNVVGGIAACFRDAGHILGSAITELWADDRKLVYSGDLGPKGTPILHDPESIAHADLVLMESTYGNRNHKGRAETISELGRIFEDAWRDKGNVCIPAFAVGRTQELLYWFARHWDEWQLSRWQIFLDSPMAGKVVEVYDRHEGLFDEDAKKVWAGKPSPFRLPNLHVTQDREESMAINRLESGAIIIAGSGMASGGRILHHFMQNIGRRQAHVVFVGYQAEGTLGRRMVDGAKWVRIHGSDFRVNAQVHTVGGLSAHADQNGLMAWYEGFSPHPALALVHGEDLSREALAGEIGERDGIEVVLARPGLTLQV